jgi:hypothetical protein
MPKLTPRTGKIVTIVCGIVLVAILVTIVVTFILRLLK